ncbi:Carbon monoxide dehydrogenase subunit G [Pseudomonas sp. NFACC02]|uniref:SRPBCC family protein n=1 Tax=Pseudomonas TaxID=286 RepID=UPI000785FEB3|nr:MULTISPECIES: SRPBCC family protein [Pseudomonas]SEQ92595.1 Carbon monoxide dehydrogenase subunit G [Pseudomonas sp. NFACC02]
MDIEQSFSVPFSPDVVWKSFHDVEGIVTCLPGASLTEPPHDDQLSLAMTVKLGPIVAAFKGQGAIALDEARRSGVVSGQGSDRKSGSRVKGTAQFELLADGASGTRVNVVVDYSITGSLAQFSRGGIVRELATRMTEAFAENLKSRLEAANDTAIAADPGAEHVHALPGGDSGVEPVPSVSPIPDNARGAAEPQAPLDLGNMFWALLLGRLRRLFGLKEKRRCPTCGK